MILVVEDKPSMRRMLRETLEGAGYKVDEAADGEEALKKLSLNHYQLVLTDVKLPKKDGLAVLRAAREVAGNLPVILMTAYGTVESAVQAMKDGAVDFLTKPFDSDYLLRLIERALERYRLYTENLVLKEGVAEKMGFPKIVGASRAMQQVSALIQKVAPSNATALLLGESGTGKELFARAIHQMGTRAGRPFIAINCAAIPDTLLENELFGHEKGAYTGAQAQKQGKFELADGGTLFLDEIGDLSPAVQAKLLRVLQDGAFERVGGTKPIQVDVRIIAATNTDLARAVRDRKFREDLFFRLNVFPISIPPLRDRPEDIPMLVTHFVYRFAQEMRKEIREVTPEALKALMAYPWPGNVRELENFIERAVILTTGPALTVQDFALGLKRGRGERESEFPLTGSLHEVGARASARAERDLIVRTLQATGGNKSKAAEMLQVSYKTLLNKIKEFGIEATPEER
ncbi:MAG TPA: sigma-54 dependent transcriptional regulator [Candidatus Methylomirabilis sp.]|jgi:DNA-binding NtrC family response regulator|nr:sigma-54 dependent transcriptional regulator [Candidatus Methylomirabilis sp.]